VPGPAVVLQEIFSDVKRFSTNATITDAQGLGTSTNDD
jgi:hypothetical protein